MLSFRVYDEFLSLHVVFHFIIFSQPRDTPRMQPFLHCIPKGRPCISAPTIWAFHRHGFCCAHIFYVLSPELALAVATAINIKSSDHNKFVPMVYLYDLR